MTSLRPWLLIAATLPLAGCGALSGAAHVATGLASHQVCSAAFVSRIDPQAFRREAVDPELGPARWLMRTKVDRAGRSVSASLAGMATTRAVYRGPSGCLVLQGAPPPPPPEPIPAPRQHPWPRRPRRRPSRRL
uniref:Lipoprotein n=1 Tax=Phenylobacterium glaciei TaxID=2803784 RepID=A0A974P5Z5_9CAUL|nr:hypothetical protein JKL49_07395 [Phenylobacterium glaciei]